LSLFRGASPQTSAYPPEVVKTALAQNAAAIILHYDPGYVDLERKTLQPLDNPLGARLLRMS
jgi:hypothetical protein